MSVAEYVTLRTEGVKPCSPHQITSWLFTTALFTIGVALATTVDRSVLSIVGEMSATIASPLLGFGLYQLSVSVPGVRRGRRQHARGVDAVARESV